jgi:hypothetical protein
VKIHYKGFHPKFDEWITLKDVPSRIRPYGRSKNIPRKDQGGPKQFQLPRSSNSRATYQQVPGTRSGRDYNEDKGYNRVKSPHAERSSSSNSGPGGELTTYNTTSVQQEAQINRTANNNQQEDSESTLSPDDARTRRIGNLSEQYARYADALGKQGLTVVPVLGDGNCLFRAVAHQIYGDETYHDIVRAKCLDYMEAESEFFCQFVEGGKELFPLYLQAKRMDACWGDDPEIEVGSGLLFAAYTSAAAMQLFLYVAPHAQLV